MAMARAPQPVADCMRWKPVFAATGGRRRVRAQILYASTATVLTSSLLMVGLAGHGVLSLRAE